MNQLAHLNLHMLLNVSTKFHCFKCIISRAIGDDALGVLVWCILN